ncbi:MAG: hypothetical protein JWN17_822 [Frankiales bacterium]|nr:hypothetical protein [Frankiales bacterium]
MNPSSFVRWGSAGLSATALTLGLPLLATSAPASAQTAPSASPCPSASATPVASATPTATTSPTSIVPGVVTSLLPTTGGGSASASPTATTSPSATATATTSPAACPTVTPSATATVTTSPSASSTITPTAPGQDSDPISATVSPTTITPGVPSFVRATGRPGTLIELVAYSRPNTKFAVVRGPSPLDADGQLTFRITPGTNTRLFVRKSGTAETTSQFVVNVRTALSLTVVRNGRRSYTLQGRILPRRAGQLITLYRVANGREILTSQIKTDSSGTYFIPRRFTGSGNFGFLTRTGQTLTNAAGVSNGGKARPTAIF